VKEKTFLILIIFIVLPVYIYAGQYFSCNEMDHFSVEGKCENKKQTQNQQQSSSDIERYGFTKEQIEAWAEPTVDESGKIVSKLPPLPVLRILTDPNEQTAKEYLEWNQKRIDAITNAQALIQKASSINTDQQQIDDTKKIKSVEFYFSPNCPYCLTQATVIESLARTIGYQKVKAYVTGYSERVGEFVQKTGMKVKVYVDLKKIIENRIDAVPVTIIETIDGKKVRFDGYNPDFFAPSQ
jgi:thiol-disulfide isomerase/thioredoxin